MPMVIARHLIEEQEDLVVINKPAGLLVIPDRFHPEWPCLSRMLEARYGKIWVVHRLDRDTSGVIVFARSEAAHRHLSAAFQERKVEKTYLGLVTGRPPQTEGRIDTPIMEHPGKGGQMRVGSRGKPAVTTYEVLQSFGLYSLLRLQIHTGRTHQIRVHLQSIGHPIAMDPLYGQGEPFYLSRVKRGYRMGRFQEEEKPLMSRMALHASALALTDEKGQRRLFEAPLPKDFQAVLHQLRKLPPLS